MNGEDGINTSLYMDRRYDQLTYLTAHNAYANSADGWHYVQQTYTVNRQLREGVRALMLDVYEHRGDLYLCHKACAGTEKQAQNPGPNRRFVDTLKEIKTFMQRTPGQIITLLLESYVKDHVMLRKAFRLADVEGTVFYADQPEQMGWDVRTQGWPTIGWLLEQGKQIIVFSEQKHGEDGLPYLWDFAVENQWGRESVNPATWCQPRPESAALNDPRRALFLMNHFETFTALRTPLLPGWVNFALINDLITSQRYRQMNDGRRVWAHIGDCYRAHGRLPNFIAVDFFQRGMRGGARGCIRQINTIRLDAARLESRLTVDWYEAEFKDAQPGGILGKLMKWLA